MDIPKQELEEHVKHYHNILHRLSLKVGHEGGLSGYINWGGFGVLVEAFPFLEECFEKIYEKLNSNPKAKLSAKEKKQVEIFSFIMEYYRSKECNIDLTTYNNCFDM